MSTVTLSQPQPAMTSAEKPLGMASQALMQALPACRRFFSMFDDISAFPFSVCLGTPDHRRVSGAGPRRLAAVRTKSAFDRAGGQAFDDVFLQQHDQDHGWRQRQQA